MGDTLGWETGVRQCAHLHPGGAWRHLARSGGCWPREAHSQGLRTLRFACRCSAPGQLPGVLKKALVLSGGATFDRLPSV